MHGINLMKQPSANAIIGLVIGFILFLMYALMMSGCFVEEVNIYNVPVDDVDNNKTCQLIKTSGKEDGKKGNGLDQS